MPVLTSQQRKLLEDACIKGRRTSEQAAQAALTSLAITAERPPPHLNKEDRQLRRGLRAKARQLGDKGDDLDLLVAECAYEQWHRLLFARFLSENNLLIHPEYFAPVSIGDCDELADSLDEPEGWSVAARFAAEILPGIFRRDDPCARLRLAPEGRLGLESILGALPQEVFVADDALGWVYQFWQKDKKDEVNASERKIGGSELGPVTQLFTENYMVRFLLENSLGAWWAARHPVSPLVSSFEYLRIDDKGEPAAGQFSGWPVRAAEITVMDPCCGSGHFLVEAFVMLWQMRAEEEMLSPTEAQDATLRDNLFGLELDARCVQIAMFSVALTAWKAGGGWRNLPVPNIACAGIPVKAAAADWRALADGDARLDSALAGLHALFRSADVLGSLINPRHAAQSDEVGSQLTLDRTDWAEVAPLLDEAGRGEGADPATRVLGVDAAGTARAAHFMSRRYTLVVTNVPYLTRRRQSEALRRFSEEHFPTGKDDLATTFLLRCWEFTNKGGAFQVVAPQAWTNLKSYQRLREDLFTDASVLGIVKLGPGAFRAISGEVVNVVLASFCASSPAAEHVALVADLEGMSPLSTALMDVDLTRIHQRTLRSNPDSIVTYKELADLPLLSEYADGLVGMMTGDSPRFIRFFWEVGHLGETWAYQQSTVRETTHYGGREHIMMWQGGSGIYKDYVIETDGKLGGAPFRGGAAWGKRGVSISQMAPFRATLYSGELFDNNAAVIFPHQADLVAPIWHFCTSGELEKQLRSFNSSMKVEASTLVRVPFDIGWWREVAEQTGPLPEPRSDDPTQWLFEGHAQVATTPLHVAVARLAGYRWPEQPESDDLAGLADSDGIVCLPSVAGEPPAADRLQQLLAAAFGQSWSLAKQGDLLEGTGSRRKNLGDWLRDDFFKQHCALFGNRPFVWHIWDGKPDGFSALLNYHRLDPATLEKLTYTYLGDWIERQRAEVRDEIVGAEARLAAASKLRSSLELILEGEPPYDIYVRWKSLAEQPIGWDPDFDAGVRVNIRPFVEAGVLRSSFNIHWRKDRGTNPDGSARLNDLHHTNTEKLAARGAPE